MKILFLCLSLILSFGAMAMGDPNFVPANPEHTHLKSMQETTATLNAIEPTEKQEMQEDEDIYQEIERTKPLDLRGEHERNNSQQIEGRTP